FDTVRKFQDGTNRVLIATDIIARGLDLSGVSHVINFDVPEEPENYMHRIGRTGRAGEDGISITFITPKEDDYQIMIEALMNRKIPIKPLPEGLEISDVLTPDEIQVVVTKNIQDKFQHRTEPKAFHEKSAKNKKVNAHLTRADKHKLKYGKPKTRGQKKKG
ncbi:MAG: box helicase domain protein, partial [Bacteroidota bacterium]|nr:box helicase domain protein [Bacteroidota bacterium]